MRKSRSAVIGVALLLAACSLPAPDESPATSRETGGPSATGSGATSLPEAGQPYSGTEILDAMRDSRRPGGVPDELETDAVASAIADAIWTFDGQPWSAMAIGASCGAASCTVEVVGTRDDASGEDLWTFEAVPDEEDVELIASDLTATPDDIVSELDRVARQLVPIGTLDDLALASTRWLAPPDNGAFVLAYRSGNEEGSCAVDIALDPIAPRIVSSEATDC